MSNNKMLLLDTYYQSQPDFIFFLTSQQQKLITIYSDNYCISEKLRPKQNREYLTITATIHLKKKGTTALFLFYSFLETVLFVINLY